MQKFVFVILLSLFSSISFSQTLTSSPYSRYGLGDVQGGGFVLNQGMGGAGIAWRSDTITPTYINLLNPASMSSVKLTTIEFGLLSNTTQFQTLDEKFKLNNTSFGYVGVALPIKKWWGLSFGLLPYSTVGYKIHDQRVQDTIGTVDYNYQGTGGINKVFLSNGFNLLPAAYTLRTGSYLSIGMNTSYMFGSINNIRHVSYSDPNYYNLRIDETQHIHDVSVDFGIQYGFMTAEHKTIKKVKVEYPKGCAYRDKNKKDTLVVYNKCKLDSGHRFLIFFKRYKCIHGDSVHYVNANLTVDKVKVHDPLTIGFGITFAPAMGLNSSSDLLARTYLQPGFYEIYKDTILNAQNQNSIAKIPMKVGAGLSISNSYKWNLLLDYSFQQWSAYTFAGNNPGLLNSQQASLGFQFQPTQRGPYYKVARYRMGLKYNQTYLDLDNTQLVEYGFTLGAAFPVSIAKVKKHEYDVSRNRYNYYSMVNIGAEFGTRGTTSNGLVKETYARVTLGFTINDRWFVKYKVD